MYETLTSRAHSYQERKKNLYLFYDLFAVMEKNEKKNNKSTLFIQDPKN